MKTVDERDIDVVIISEQNRNLNFWYTDSNGDSAIWLTNKGISKASNIKIVKQKVGMIAINYNNMLIISSYITPNIDDSVAADRLDDIREVICSKKWMGVLLAGDLNGKSPLWGGNEWNNRGKMIIEYVINLGLTPIYTHGGITCTRGNGSKVDILITSTNLVYKVISSKVLTEYTASDHLYLQHVISINEAMHPEKEKMIKVNKAINAKIFVKKILSIYGDDKDEKGRTYESEEEIRNFIMKLKEIGDRSRRKVKLLGKEPVYWWNNEIATLRKEANKARRIYTRSKKSKIVKLINRAEQEYKHAKRMLNKNITKAKKEAWDKLIGTVDHDIWGKPYKTIMRQIKPSTPPVKLDLEQVKEIVKGLFIMEPVVRDEIVKIERYDRNKEVLQYLNEDSEQRDGDEVTVEDVIMAAKKIMIKKAPGPDGIPAIAAREIGLGAAKNLQKLFNGCILLGCWPDEWKETRLVLLPKGKSSTNCEREGDKFHPSDFRPLCIASNMAKMFEHVVKMKLLKELENRDFSNDQYGFRKGLSTVHAMVKVMNLWDRAKKEGRHCLMIMLDVRNAFNTLRWESVTREMTRRGFSFKIIRLIKAYLKNRWIVINATDGSAKMQVFGGVPQGSVIGPFMWNLVYDGFLELQRRRDVYFIAFADDVGIIIIEKNLEYMKVLADKVMKDIVPWFTKEGLELAPHKSISILLTGRKCLEGIPVKIKNEDIIVSNKAKYLGVTFEKNQVFKEHIKITTDKAIKYALHLCSLQPNIKGVGIKPRILYYRVVESVVMYASPIWERALKYTINIKRLRETQRIPLSRVLRAYRTVSLEVLCILAGFPPWDLLVKERSRVFKRIQEETANMDKKEKSEKIKKIKEEEHENKMNDWQREWECSSKGRWVYQIIPTIGEWIKDGIPQLDYHTVQIMTGHGCFSTYLKKINKEETSRCWFCEEEVDSPEHFLFKCPKWSEDRRQLELILYPEEWCLSNLQKIIKNKKYNAKVREYISKGLREKEKWEKLNRENIRPKRYKCNRNSKLVKMDS